MKHFDWIAISLLILSCEVAAKENYHFNDPISGELVTYDFSKGEIVRRSRGEQVILKGIESGCAPEFEGVMEFCISEPIGGLYVKRNAELLDMWEVNGSSYSLISGSFLNMLGCKIKVSVIDERVMKGDLYRRYFYSRDKGVIGISFLKDGGVYSAEYFEPGRTLWRVDNVCGN